MPAGNVAAGLKQSKIMLEKQSVRANVPRRRHRLIAKDIRFPRDVKTALRPRIVP
jgi:hypothetical protein